MFNLGNIGKGLQQFVGATFDPLNISGYGGIPGVNSNGRTISDGISDVTGQTDANRAMESQTKGAAQANQVLGQQYGVQTDYLKQLAGYGQDAMSQLQSGSFANNYQQSPGYAAQLAAGQTAINNSMAARGMVKSGAALKALTGYSQDLANQDYQQYYNNEYNRLNNLAGINVDATNNLATAANQYGANLSNNITGLANAQAAASMAKSNQNAALLQQGVGLGASYLFSDERLKTNITEIPKEDIEEMKRLLTAYYFGYKNADHGKGEWAGVMAQDLEKSKIGKLLVVEDSQGNKTIDQNKVLSMFLATMAEREAA